MSSSTESLPLPAALVAEVQAVADEEQRPATEIVREALERYLETRRWQRVLAYGEKQARKMGLTEADVPRLIEEYRQERRQGDWRQAFALTDLSAL
jgi:predicted transcriptional regulator